jgi:hypothetical protein
MKWVTRITCFTVLGILALSSYIYVQNREARRAEAQMRASEILAVSQMLHQATVRYTREKGRPPKTVDELVDAGYFRGVPVSLAGYFPGIPSVGPVYFDPAPPAFGRPETASLPAT